MGPGAAGGTVSMSDNGSPPYANSVSARWHEAMDPESGILGYYYGLGRTSGVPDLVNWTFTRNRQVTMENLPLAQGDEVTFMVRGVNGTGRMGEIGTRSMTVHYDDDTPPVHAPQVAATYDERTDVLIASWWGDGGDPESGVVEYKWAVKRGTVEPAESEWQSTGTERRMETTRDLRGGNTYYILVRSINGAGLYSTGSSEGITLILRARARRP